MEINLFTFGDSGDISTWSNLPYFFSKALLNRGARLNRIDLLPNERAFYRAYRLIIERIEDALNRRGVRFDAQPFRDPLSIEMIQRKIRREVRRHPRAEANVFLTFSFSSSGLSRTPSINYCDETYEQFLIDSGRTPAPIDRFLIGREKRILDAAAFIFTTGRLCADFIRRRHPSKEVHELNSGVNMEAPRITDAEALLAEKRRSKSILFIGMGYRKRGVDVLLKAFEDFNRRNQNAYTLHVVGEGLSGGPPAGSKIRYYGYLDKSIPQQAVVYWELIRKARLFVMPMREGPLPGVIKEVGLLFTPVVVTDIWHVGDVVQDGVNGNLVPRPSVEGFAERMHALANDDLTWERLARNANKSAQRFSWDRTAEVFMERIQGGLHGHRPAGS
jgi:glycosyltransferase involved in cell wall biosynthesis